MRQLSRFLVQHKFQRDKESTGSVVKLSDEIDRMSIVHDHPMEASQAVPAMDSRYTADINFHYHWYHCQAPVDAIHRR